METEQDLQQLIALTVAKLERACSGRRDALDSKSSLGPRYLIREKKEPDAERGEVRAGPAARFALLPPKKR